MATLRGAMTSDSGLRLLRMMRWLLPLSLAVIALSFELNEHISEGVTQVEPWFYAEILLFAILGPTALFLVLLWVERLVMAYKAASEQLTAVNRDLEARIAERTTHLTEATDQLRAANEGLARANDDLRELDRLKSEFVSLVSHQLRAPLTNINGALEIVSADAESLPAETQRTLRILTREGQRLSWLIQTILDVSRLEAGRLQPRIGPVAVGPLLAEACAATLDVQPSRDHELRIEDDLPPAWADETLLGEVVRNLIENAMRYAPAETPIIVSATLDDETVEISVTDHGPGVPLEEQARIFQSFYRVSDDEASVKGSGLGLYFADRLVRAQGASIRIESPVWPDETGRGTRFTIELPVVQDVPYEQARSDEQAGETMAWRAS